MIRFEIYQPKGEIILTSSVVGPWVEYKDVEALIIAVGAWWRGSRPLDFSREDHLKNPTVNLPTEKEMKLAMAYVTLIKGSKDD